MLNLQRLISKYGQYKLVPSQPDEIRFNCPYCVQAGKLPDRKFHLYINIKKGVGHCFRCGKKLKFNGNGNCYKVEQAITVNVRRPKHILSSIPQSLPITKDSPAFEFLRYKFLEIFSEEELFARIESFGLNYCVDMRYSHLVDRIIIPVTFHGKVVACQFRSIYGQEPKYLSYSLNGRNIKEYLYNFDNALKSDEVWIMEGVFDVFATFDNAVAIFGKEISKPQAELIVKYFSRVIIALDQDAYKEACKIAKQLSRMGNFEKIGICKLPEGKDPGELGRDILDCEIEEFLVEDFLI